MDGDGDDEIVAERGLTPRTVEKFRRMALQRLAGRGASAGLEWRMAYGVRLMQEQRNGGVGGDLYRMRPRSGAGGVEDGGQTREGRPSG